MIAHADGMGLSLASCPTLVRTTPKRYQWSGFGVVSSISSMLAFYVNGVNQSSRPLRSPVERGLTGEIGP